MLRVRGWVWGLMLLVGAAGGGALAQQKGERAPAESVGAELRGLASRAGVVFVGQVETIEFKGGMGGAPNGDVVEITFTVQQPVLGVVGGRYVMREWAGRWTGGQEDFRVGQRAMFFLHAPSAAGLSSAVDGMMGVVPVVGMGANGQALLDVRWVATRVRRAMDGPLVGAAGTSTGGIALADGVAVTRSWRTEGMAEPKGVRLPEGVLGQVSKAGALEAEQHAGPVSVKEAGDAQH
jgi:hypothetical protein